MLVFMYRGSDDTLGYKNMPNQTHFVQHNDDIYVGNIKLKVLHTPGHTPESISFYLLMKVLETSSNGTIQWILFL